MRKDKKMTVSEWDTFEVEKRAALEGAKSKIETLKARRGEMLLLIADGDEKTGKMELEKIEKEIKENDIEIESLLSLLIVIPRRRDLAQANEIEVAVTEIEQLDIQLSDLEPKIDADIETLVLVLRQYFDLLDALYKISPTRMNVRGGDSGIKNAISFYLHKYSLFERMPIGDFRGSKPLIESPYRAHKTIAGYIGSRRSHVKELRGIEKMNPNICKSCYGNFVYDTAVEKRRCGDCGLEEN